MEMLFLITFLVVGGRVIRMKKYLKGEKY